MDYRKLVKEEARAFYKAARAEYQKDTEEFGGRSETPNLAKWIDRKGELSRRVEEITSKWTHKDFLWVQSNTRNPEPKTGGDPRSHAYASFLKDVRHEIKKLSKSDKSR